MANKKLLLDDGILLVPRSTSRVLHTEDQPIVYTYSDSLCHGRGQLHMTVGDNLILVSSDEFLIRLTMQDNMQQKLYLYTQTLPFGSPDYVLCSMHQILALPCYNLVTTCYYPHDHTPIVLVLSIYGICIKPHHASCGQIGKPHLLIFRRYRASCKTQVRYSCLNGLGRIKGQSLLSLGV